jgi:hypothetical protein
LNNQRFANDDAKIVCVNVVFSYSFNCRKYAEMLEQNTMITNEQLVLYKARIALKHPTSSLGKFYHPKQLKLSLFIVAYADVILILSFLLVFIIK